MFDHSKENSVGYNRAAAIHTIINKLGIISGLMQIIKIKEQDKTRIKNQMSKQKEPDKALLKELREIKSFIRQKYDVILERTIPELIKNYDMYYTGVVVKNKEPIDIRKYIQEYVAAYPQKWFNYQSKHR